MLSGFSRPSQRTLAYLLASARNPSPEGLSFESLLRVEISFGIARIIPCGAIRPRIVQLKFAAIQCNRIKI
jgi:hypothetical protein